MGELGETLASLFQGFDVFGAEVWHRRLDINRDQSEAASHESAVNSDV